SGRDRFRGEAIERRRFTTKTAKKIGLYGLALDLSFGGKLFHPLATARELFVASTSRHDRPSCRHRCRAWYGNLGFRFLPLEDGQPEDGHWHPGPGRRYRSAPSRWPAP